MWGADGSSVFQMDKFPIGTRVTDLWFLEEVGTVVEASKNVITVSWDSGRRWYYTRTDAKHFLRLASDRVGEYAKRHGISRVHAVFELDGA